MRMSSIAAIASTVLVIVVAGCANGERAMTAMPFDRRLAHETAAERVVYSFSGPPSDGEYPTAALIDLKGTLYGTTSSGGTTGGGTVFSLTPSGTETPIYSFKGYPNDGTAPNAVIAIHGTLYGTTACDGSYGYGGGGVVFSLTKRGEERVLYNFPGGDCDGPYAGLLDVSGTLYGTTWGSPSLDGRVFSITTSGTEKTIHQFTGGRDGGNPLASLIDVNDTLYGTTSAGGVNHYAGFGTAFSMTTSGKERVLHRFRGARDGNYPSAGLIDIGGTIYGTTTYDGIVGGKCGTYGCGTVFEVTPSGKEIVLHRFRGSPDGENPMAALIDVNGTLYGTTYEGGATGAGSVFSIAPSGSESVVYSFAGGTYDGSNPLASLIDVNGTLYGTTYGGGTYGFGTVFSLTP